MPSVVIDIIDGSDLIETEDAIEKTRIALVKDVTNGTNAEREWDALSASGVPAIGDALGSTAPLSNVTLVRRSVRPASKGSTHQMEVVLEYSSRRLAIADPDDETLPTYESGTVLQTFSTNQDVNGNKVVLQYTYPSDYAINPDDAGKTITTGATFDVQRPATTEVMRRVEVGIDPEPLAEAYVGKVNNATWLNRAPGVWLCTGITGTSRDAGVTWEMEYTFQKNSDGWNNRKVVIEDPNTGRPPPDVVADSGISAATGLPGNPSLEDSIGLKTVQSYETADFDILQLI